MNSNTILFIGSLLVVATTVLWKFDYIEEPSSAFASAALTALAFYFSKKEEKRKAADAQVLQQNQKGDNIHIGRQINQGPGSTYNENN